MKKSFRILKFKKDKPIFEVRDVSKSFSGRSILKKSITKSLPWRTCIFIWSKWSWKKYFI
jgi:hypothetical protein